MSKVVATVTVARFIGTIQVEVTELVWNDGGRSFDVVRVDNGEDLTEDSSLDHSPDDDEIRKLLDCPHVEQYVNDRSQFVCSECGEELGR